MTKLIWFGLIQAQVLHMLVIWAIAVHQPIVVEYYMYNTLLI